MTHGGNGETPCVCLRMEWALLGCRVLTDRPVVHSKSALCLYGLLFEKISCGIREGMGLRVHGIEFRSHALLVDGVPDFVDEI